MNENIQIQNLPIDKLHDFKNHPFKLYEGKRADDMEQSVKANGIITPIIVRPKGNDYEILSGHNRVAAARKVGLSEIPAVVRYDVDDEQALLIVTLTNLQQRGFGELYHSERAKIIRLTYDSLKHQGKRSDLLDEVDLLVGGKQLLSVNRKKLNPKDALSEQFGLTPNNIAYYLRIEKLIEPFVERLDNGELELTVAEKLTYLDEEQQQVVYDVAGELGIKVTIGKAKALVNLNKKAPLTAETARNILTERKVRKSSYRLNLDVYEQFFADTEHEQIDDIILQALELWKETQG
ncbi:hypothetical protein FACS189499_04660 [Clostridia bacterium]|nr:hypothetical protein FACS189499_04660 [Clostridia bacterium]